MCEDEFYYVKDMHIVGVNQFTFTTLVVSAVTVDIQLRECVQRRALQQSRKCGHSVSALKNNSSLWIFDDTRLLCHSPIAKVTKKKIKCSDAFKY